jgi:transposase
VAARVRSRGKRCSRQVKRLFKLWYQERGGESSRERLAALMSPVQRKVKALLQAGARSGHKKTRRTCANIIKVEQCLWTFVRVRGVEPTNNAAERALRRAVLWRRKSFGTQSSAGSLFVGRILTAVSTLRQQGREVLEYLAGVCAAPCAIGDGSMRLLPQPP